ncbi:MAG TPA: XshC-Cox1-family protein [Microscillaceae bacterium]|nr:XshC-Cox1-family protein [Microscillaceae bacterium]
MFDTILDKAQELRAKGEAFAIAIVVNYKAPISGKPGFKAIIRESGSIFGWIGGGCSQPAVINEARKSIKDGKPRLVKISPDGTTETEDGVVKYNMNCHSEGTLEVYIEPVIPKPHLIILGKSPVAQALVKLAKAIDYRVSVMAPDIKLSEFKQVDRLYTRFHAEDLQKDLAITPYTFMVVSTQGTYDEEALEMAAHLNLPYVAFVASKKKATAVFDYLKHRDIAQERIDAIKAPAGLDIGGRLPEEIAVSILAEIIAQLRNQDFAINAQTLLTSGHQSSNQTVESIIAQEVDQFKNPVCGMMVDKATAKFVIDYKDEQYYFCCTGCKVAFEEDPEKYAAMTDY